MSARKIFVNLAVKDLAKTRDFFSQLGFEFNEQFSNDNAVCMVLGNDAYAMLLTEPFFKGFVRKELCDTATHVEAICAISAASREDVDDLCDKAIAAGGRPAGEPTDMGFMYSRSFEDSDGHIWEPVWMDPSAIEPQ